MNSVLLLLMSRLIDIHLEKHELELKKEKSKPTQSILPLACGQ